MSTPTASPAIASAAAPVASAAPIAVATAAENGTTAPAVRPKPLIKRKEPIPEDTPISEDERLYVKEFRAKMNGKADTLTDMTVLRFIRGFCCSENPEAKALEMLGKMTEWRAKEKVDEIAKMKISFKADFNETWNSGIHGLDKVGHPVFIDRPGLCDPNQLKAKNFDIAKIMLVHIQHMESLVATETAVSASRGLNRYKHIAIIDMQGLGMKHLAKEFYTPMKTIIDIDQYYYPDTLYKLFVVNAPFIFRAMWAIVSPMVDPVTRTKIEFGTTNLLNFIDKESLPQFLGGTCKCEGGKCLRTKFVSGKGECLPDIDIGRGPKDEKGEIVKADPTATAAAPSAPPADATAAAPSSSSSAAATANGQPNGQPNGSDSKANGFSATATAASTASAPTSSSAPVSSPASSPAQNGASPATTPASASA